MTYYQLKDLRIHHAIRWQVYSLDPETQNEIEDIFDWLREGKHLGMPLSRPMPVIGRGTHELRIKDSSRKFRIFYYTKHHDAILIFHMFQKTTRETPIHEIRLGKKRLKEML